jgi:hypothetical protein
MDDREAELVTRAQPRDAAAFTALVHRHYSLARVYAWRPPASGPSTIC